MNKIKTLPKIEITPAMAMRFARNQHLKVPWTEALEWLMRNKNEIERRAKEAVDEDIQEVLLDVTLWEWPEPAFNKMHNLINRALYKADSDYAESRNAELVRRCSWGDEIYRLVRTLAAQGKDRQKDIY